MNPFAIEELQFIFRRMHNEKWAGILIGGQAVNLYVNHYAERSPVFASLRPWTSRDLDFHGGPREVKRAMMIFNASGKINDGTNPSPNAGVFQIELESGQFIVVDVLTSVFGVSASELIRSAIRWSLLDDCPVQVIHPMLLLESKIACLRSLQQMDRQDEKHVRLMIHVVNVWLQDQLSLPRDVFRAIERIAAMMVTPDGISVFERGIDLWDAIPLAEMRSSNVFDEFFEKRLPQLKRVVSERRSVDEDSSGIE